MSYAFPPGGLPGQSAEFETRAVFTQAYVFIPASVQTDIVTSFLPDWTGMRAWILAKPLSGFAETFAQYAVELASGGGSAAPEPDRDAQAVLFVATGTPQLTIGQEAYDLRPGSFAFLPAGTTWELWNRADETCGIHWVRKRYEPVGGLPPPEPKVIHEAQVEAEPMPDCGEVWSTQRFFDPLDLAYDFHVNIVNFQPGGRIPFPETHVMEHGIYVLQGTARYLLNEEWIDVGPGDFMWLRAFCPQACIATGDQPFRYLLYKDVNRHPSLEPAR